MWVYVRNGSALLLTTDEIQRATDTLASFRSGAITREDVSDEELWRARRGASRMWSRKSL